MAGDNEMGEILNDEAEQPTAQQYEGDDISALATAKQRMAERDAEYSAAFAKAEEKPEDKPAAKRSAKPRSKPAVTDHAVLAVVLAVSLVLDGKASEDLRGILEIEPTLRQRLCSFCGVVSDVHLFIVATCIAHINIRSYRISVAGYQNPMGNIFLLNDARRGDEEGDGEG